MKYGTNLHDYFQTQASWIKISHFSLEERSGFLYEKAIFDLP